MSDVLDRVAETALVVISDVADVDPAQTFATLTALAQDEPEHFARVMMCLAIWVGDATTGELRRREAIAAGLKRAA